MSATLEARALAACNDYDRWKREVDRLTKEIKANECPRVEDGTVVEGDDGLTFTTHESCFHRLSNHTTGRFDEARRLYLTEIAAHPEIKACPACSRLCEAIAERTQARRKWGAAKRAIRRVARLAGRTTGGEA